MINSDKLGVEYVTSDALFVRHPNSAWETTFSKPYMKFFKRPLDLVLALLVLVPAVLIMLPFAALIALDGSSPVFVQRRVGKGGRVFKMFKLRSMRADAEYRLQAYLDANPDQREEWECSQKLRSDPRITAIGRFIRRTSIDELPQLFNVILGDMSLVGPRPMMPSQRALYSGMAYYALRPGITGPWQVSDRNESEFSKRAEHDTHYNETLSLPTDLMLLFKTVRVVIKGTGY